MASDQTKIIAGGALLVLSAALLFATGMLSLSVPIVLAALATTGLAVGSLLVGTTGDGRAV
ncbi:hypothetical protein [Halalkalicoccus jeotgali]|uniref:Uncharacterized protein n=1 Tax=Halalkalicoccus jeotgali (strain DSM 18796 / CECT 7217 / JCM 14584 / KCTC 4019 / B3) TaxID=795797 RepID=D8J8A1_HALJB|nr:hypothetical protein [Halalkalicoccus jeotgali]ADJ16147.1 hypothetical protein HacjB3_13830 [Halalkalicoccus jeotgali B3]ELY37576.1 hypothetical protein C497_09043 [Halalkalicoccus jeotgali B3]